MKRRKCSSLVSGRSAPGEETSSDHVSSRSRRWCDALAEREIHAVWVIDVQAKRLARRMLECDQLDPRIKLMDPVFDLPVKLVQLSFR